MRVFAACRLDLNAAADLNRVLEPLRTRYSDKHFRWVVPRNYHVTLRFFGDVPAEAAAEIGGLIRAIALAETPFDCRTGAPTALPNVRRPSVVALPIESNGRLERLAKTCNFAFAARFGEPDKPFRAHLTVVRCRPGARFHAADGAIEFPLVFSTVGLYESVQAEGGVCYSALHEFRFGRAATA